MDSGTIAIRKTGLTATQIKTIAIIAMLIDHIAWKWVPILSVEGQIMHIIGRLTAPIMCYFIAQGYYYTKSFSKYILRIALFALVSHIPFVLEGTGRISLLPFSVMYTLALGLLAIRCYDKINNKILRWVAIIGIGILSFIGDWMFFGIAFCLIFYIYRDNFKKQCIGIICVGVIEIVLILLNSLVSGGNLEVALVRNLFQLSIILSLPVLSLYNGEKGGNKFSKWSFYIFYPLHLLILALLP